MATGPRRSGLFESQSFGVEEDRHGVADAADEAVRALVVEGEQHPCAVAIPDQASDVQTVVGQRRGFADVERSSDAVRDHRPDSATAGGVLLGGRQLVPQTVEQQYDASLHLLDLKHLEVAAPGSRFSERRLNLLLS